MFTWVKSIARSAPDHHLIIARSLSNACPLVTRSLSNDCPLSARSLLTVLHLASKERVDQVHTLGCTATTQNKSQLYSCLWHASTFGVCPHLSKFLLLSSPSSPATSKQVNPLYTYTTGHRFFICYAIMRNYRIPTKSCYSNWNRLSIANS